MLVAERGNAMWANPAVVQLRQEAPREVDVHGCAYGVQSIPDESGERGMCDRVDRVQSSFVIQAKLCTRQEKH